LLSHELDKWVEYYNRNYLHSALGYITPVRRLINWEAYNLSFEKYNFAYVYH